MRTICTLAADINECEYFYKDTCGCGKPEQKCLFLEIEPQKTKPEQMERRVKWYEKYYEKR